MPKTLLCDFSAHRASEVPTGNSPDKPELIELNMSLLVQVGGGVGPNGTWLAAPAPAVTTLGPNGTW